MEHNTFAGSSGNDNYSTPKDFIAKLEVQLGLRFDDFDPCPINPEGLRTYDGNASWPEKVGRKPLENVFINFPYSDPVPWLRRCVRESQNGKTVAALMRGDTSTIWFHELVRPFVAELIFVRGRICFRFYRKACNKCATKNPLEKLNCKKCGSTDLRTEFVTDESAPFASIVGIYKPISILNEQRAIVMRSIRV
jgi:ribosomal protein L40E